MEQKSSLNLGINKSSIFKSSIWRVFEVFADEPLKIHFIKEISRKINLAPTSVKKHTEILEKNDIIIKKKGERFLGYIANRENDDFLFYKKTLNLINLKESGFIDYLIKNFYPKTIILYGSYLKGEDVEESDIDIFILSQKISENKEINIDKFEKLLERKIHLIIEPSLKKLNKNLRTEIINGAVLYGYLKNE